MMAAQEMLQSMTLNDLLDGIVDDDVLRSCGNLAVTDLTADSRHVTPGSLFIAAQGREVHGMDFAVQAVARGAAAVLYEEGFEASEQIMRQVCEQAVCIHCPGLSQMVSLIAARFYADPSSMMKVVGVTGTDGKTSITHFIAQAYRSMGRACAVMGTLGNGFIDALQPTGLTTASAIQVQESLYGAYTSGAMNVAMEVSSHGLDQDRVAAVSFDTVVFTNLAHDHLDYHGGVEAYGEAKRKLFHMSGPRAAVINLDDEFGRELAASLRGHLSVWGISTSSDVGSLRAAADLIVYAQEIEATQDGLRISMSTPKGNAVIESGLYGLFNANNLLTVLAVMLIEGVVFEDAITALRDIEPVDGRMQRTMTPEGVMVIIDFAHTPQALESACASLRQHSDGNLHVVFGCGGDRDKEKRPMMAAAVERYADRAIVTTDNPRSEAPEAIAEDVVAGFVGRVDYEVILDRAVAIESAIGSADAGDIVLVAGKGHETTQLVGDTYIPFNDQDVVEKLIGAGS